MALWRRQEFNAQLTKDVVEVTTTNTKNGNSDKTVFNGKTYAFIEDALDIARKHSIRCEPSGIAGLALLLQMKDELPADEKILIINTGSTIYPGKGN